MPGDPEDYFVHFRLRATFSLGFLHVQLIDAGKTHRIETRFGSCRLFGHCRFLTFVVCRRVFAWVPCTWHALRYSEGRDALARIVFPSEYFRSYHRDRLWRLPARRWPR